MGPHKNNFQTAGALLAPSVPHSVPFRSRAARGQPSLTLTFMKHLETLSLALTAMDRHHAAVDALAALEEEKAARELVLLETVDLHDSKSLAELAEVRLVRELIPRKLTAMEAPSVGLSEKLRNAINKAWPIYHQALNEKCEELRALLRKHLAPICSDPAHIERHVLTAWRGNALAARLDSLSMSHDFSVGDTLGNGAEIARTLLANLEALAATVIPEKF